MLRNETQQPISRRQFVKTSCALAGGLTLADGLFSTAWAQSDANVNTAKPPNILLLMVDQWRFPFWNSSKVSFPGLERLRQEGMTFEAMYCSATPCTPSRATIFTGLHMPQHGLEINVCDSVPALNPSIPTLGHYFEHAGYRTPYFGKWHLSVEEKYQEVGLTPYGFEEWPCADSQGLPNQGAAEDPVIADQTIQWLKDHKDDTQPWLLTCSLVNPHDVMFYKRLAQPAQDQLPSVAESLPANFNDDLSTKPQAHAQYQKLWGMLWDMPGGGPNAATTYDWLKAIDYYYFVAKQADDQIVRILNTLNELDPKQETLVLFLSDHGEMVGAHRLMGKGPFAYEESVRVPLVMRWTGCIPAGATTKALAQTVDILPTLLDIAGIRPANPYLPGKSLKSLLLGSSATPVNDHVLMAYGMSIAAVTAENASYGATTTTEFSAAPWKFRALYDGTYKYVRYYEDNLTEQEYELYNLATDPPELQNLAKKVTALPIRNEMAAKLAQAEQTEMAPINAAYFNAPFGPELKIAPATAGQVQVRFDTQKEIKYQIQSTTDFQVWTDVGQVIAGTGSELETTVPITAGSRQFYRVKRL